MKRRLIEEGRREEQSGKKVKAEVREGKRKLTEIIRKRTRQNWQQRFEKEEK